MTDDDDDDMGALFRQMKEASKAKKKKNLHGSTGLLEGAGVNFVSNNGGVHLIVESTQGLVDFWPSTGLWVVRRNGLRRRGVAKLLKICEKTDDSEET